MEFSQIVYAILLGIIVKMYDDLNDMEIIKSDILNEVLKGLTWVFLSLMSINDFNFSLIFYAINLGNSIVNSKEWYNPYESSLLYVYPIFLILSFHSREYLSILDILQGMTLIFINLIEPYLFNEESSHRKMISRAMCSILALIVLVIYSLYFNISPSISKILYGSIAYGITSSLFQAYQVYIKPDATPKSSTDSIPIE
jgi:hypothetical protein